MVKKKVVKKTAAKKITKKTAKKSAKKPAKDSTPVKKASSVAGILNSGALAPEFILPGSMQGEIDLASYRGKKNVVLYFYPKDDTPGCTTEACSFRDHYDRILKTGTIVIGISPDPVKKHDRFIEKYSLQFPLASDEQNTVAKKYGVWVEKSMYGRTYMGIQRATFLINKSGKIAAAWPKVKVDGHTDEVLAAIDQL